MGLIWLALVGLPVVVEVLPDDDDLELEMAHEQLVNRPLDINSATVDDLLLLPWLDPVLAYRIVSYRDSVGRVGSIASLRSVPGVSAVLCRELGRVLIVSPAQRGWSLDASVRSSSDSLPALTGRLRTLARVDVRNQPWELRAIVEQDRGESSLFDWLGGGLGYSGRSLSFVLGDFRAGAGLGLVLSGPARRGAGAWNRDAGTRPMVKTAGSALENRGLRGGGVGCTVGPWQACGFGSSVLRDAELDSNGFVRRLVTSGVHDDSVARAHRNRVSEAAAGLVISRAWRAVRLSLTGAGVRYSRRFAADTAVGSFSGQALGNCGVGADWFARDCRLSGEAAWSSAGGFGGELELVGSWRALAARLAMRGAGANYFAPLSRSRSMTGRKARFEVSARLGYRLSGFDIGVAGRTYRDFVEDSLPARAEAHAGYEKSRFGVRLTVGQSFRLDNRRSRTGRFEFDWRPYRGSELGVVLADEYPANDTASGRLVAVVGRLESGWFSSALTGARLLVRGGGVSINLRENNTVRSGLDLSSSRSCWYAALAIRCRLRRGTGFGFTVSRVAFDAGGTWRAGAEVELSLN